MMQGGNRPMGMMGAGPMEQGFPMMPAFAFQPPMTPFPLNTDSTLFFANVHPNINEIDVYRLFAEFGPIESFRIMKNVYTNDSREFGFVTFKRKEFAEKAMKKLNGYEFFKRELRVMFKKNIKELNENANLVVKNLDEKLSTQQFSEQCSKFGQLVSCVVRRDMGNKSNGTVFGYVQFETPAEAERCITELNDKVINGKKVVVERYIPAKNREKHENSNVYLKQFDPAWKKEEIEKFIDENLGSCGKIISKGVFENKGSFYAFAAFDKPEAAKQAIEKFKSWKPEGSTVAEGLFIGPAMSKRTRAKMLSSSFGIKKNDTNLYVRSIKPEVTLEQFKKAFESYGPITSAVLKKWEPVGPVDVPPKKLQFGFVNFKTEEDAQKVQLGYKNDPEIKALIEPSENPNFIYFAQPKKLRDQFLKIQRMNQRYMLAVRQQRMQPMGPMDGFRSRGNKRPQMPFANPGMMIPQVGIPATPPTPPRPTTPSELAKPNLAKKLEVINNHVELCEAIRKNLAEFQDLPPASKKKILGNAMYKRVREKCTDESLVPKITGMLIDLEVLELPEILEIIESDPILDERVKDATEIILNPE